MQIETPWDAPCDFVFHIDSLQGIVPCKVVFWDDVNIQTLRPNGAPWRFTKGRHDAHVFRTLIEAEREQLKRLEGRRRRAAEYADKLQKQVELQGRKVTAMEAGA